MSPPSLPFSAEDSALLQDQLALLERQILLQVGLSALSLRLDGSSGPVLLLGN